MATPVKQCYVTEETGMLNLQKERFERTGKLSAKICRTVCHMWSSRAELELDRLGYFQSQGVHCFVKEPVLLLNCCVSKLY
jgi:hypothetical protein